MEIAAAIAIAIIAISAGYATPDDGRIRFVLALMVVVVSVAIMVAVTGV